MSILIGLLVRFWKPLLLVVLLTIIAVYVKNWDNNRLDAVYKVGQKSVEDFYANEERKAIETATDMFEQNKKQLFQDLERQQVLNANLNKKIKEFNKRTTFSCSPTPEYLSLWDDRSKTNSPITTYTTEAGTVNGVFVASTGTGG